MHTLDVYEIFKSIQGESSQTGLPCTFVRLAGCNLRCAYCDTPATWDTSQAKKMTLQAIESEVSKLAMPTVLVTGGEPLLQPATPDLLSMLAAATDRAVMLESNGSRLLPAYYRSWKTILDVKCPSSGEGTSFCFDNLTLLQPADELKFVISDENDFQWAQNLLQQYGFFQNHNITILFSPNVEQLSPVHLAEWLLATPHEIRLNVQLHKSLGLP